MSLALRTKLITEARDGVFKIKGPFRGRIVSVDAEKNRCVVCLPEQKDLEVQAFIRLPYDEGKETGATPTVNSYCQLMKYSDDAFYLFDISSWQHYSLLVEDYIEMKSKTTSMLEVFDKVVKNFKALQDAVISFTDVASKNVPIPMDGGSFLQSQFIVQLAKLKADVLGIPIEGTKEEAEQLMLKGGVSQGTRDAIIEQNKNFAAAELELEKKEEEERKIEEEVLSVSSLFDNTRKSILLVSSSGNNIFYLQVNKQNKNRTSFFNYEILTKTTSEEVVFKNRSKKFEDPVGGFASAEKAIIYYSFSVHLVQLPNQSQRPIMIGEQFIADYDQATNQFVGEEATITIDHTQIIDFNTKVIFVSRNPDDGLHYMFLLKDDLIFIFVSNTEYSEFTFLNSFVFNYEGLIISQIISIHVDNSLLIIATLGNLFIISSFLLPSTINPPPLIRVISTTGDFLIKWMCYSKRWNIIFAIDSLTNVQNYVL